MALARNPAPQQGRLKRLACLSLLVISLFAAPARGTPDEVPSGPADASMPWALGASSATAPHPTPAADRLFGLTNLWTFHLRLEPAAWAALEPTTLQPLFRPPQIDSWEYRARNVPSANPAPDTNDVTEDRVFDYVRATLLWEGQTLNEVGLRYKGNSTYWTARDSLKRSFKLDFNRFVRRQTFCGLKKLNLHNNALDPSQARQALAAAVFRRAGIPAPRTAFARVYLTVPGQMEGLYLGLYTAVEQVDDQFISEWFGDKSGLLMKPEYTRGLTYLGEDWKSYMAMFCPEHKATLAHAQRMVDFVRLIDCAEDEVFHRQIGAFIEARAFLRFLAVQSIIANLDSPLVHGKNYYLYLHPVSTQLVFIPWDFDLSFGLYPSAGTMAQQTELSIQHPYAGQHSWLDRFLALPGRQAMLCRQYEDLLAGPLRLERILADLDAIEEVIRQAVAEELHSSPPQGQIRPGSRWGRLESPSSETPLARMGPDYPPPAAKPASNGSPNSWSLRAFVVHRIESIRDQLAGKSTGYEPVVTEKGPPIHDRPGNVLAWQIMRLADGNRDGKISLEEFTALLNRWWVGWDTNRSGKLNQMEVKAGLEKLLLTGPEGSGAKILAGQLLWRDGVSAEYEFSAPDFLRAGAGWFESWDRDHSGFLTRPKLEQALEEILGPGW